jgi:hypothetical protein
MASDIEVDSVNRALRNRAVLLALVVAVAAPASHAADPGPRMTGESLLRRLKPVDPATVIVPDNVPGNLTKQDLAELHDRNNYEFAQGYLDALYDATEGTAWCYDWKIKNPKPDTFFDVSRSALRRFPADQLKRPAAELLVEIWRAKWPCSADRRSRK